MAGLILLVCTRFSEEFVFRGPTQRASIHTLGRFGLLYTTLLFAVLHIGYRSVADVVFVLSVAVLCGWIAQSTWSLLGVTVAQAINNIVLIQVLPWLGRWHLACLVQQRVDQASAKIGYFPSQEDPVDQLPDEKPAPSLCGEKHGTKSAGPIMKTSHGTISRLASNELNACG